MSIQSEMPGYSDVSQLPNQQGAGPTPAEMHGLTSGLLCGGDADNSWLSLVHDPTSEKLIPDHEPVQALHNMHPIISDSLDDGGFLFQLYLPGGDTVNVLDRANTLAGWINHLLFGLGASQPKLDKVKDETGEAADDPCSAAQPGYDEDENQEELETSLEEIIEYVRAAALLRHDISSHQQPTALEIRRPILH